MEKLSCNEAKQLDLVEYLNSLGFQPKKIRNQDYWYRSPFREETTASFKVNRSRNVWFDFGAGKGGTIIDFGVIHFNCSVNELLEKLSRFSPSQHFSFHPLLAAGEKKQPRTGKILILQERTLGSDVLVQYLQKRCIPFEIARQFCREIDFELYGKKYLAIGFRNDQGGFELRNEHFKGSSSPKSPTFFDYGGNDLNVFEGFFDFLSFQALSMNSTTTTNSLVLNTLFFFHHAKDVMNKHQTVHLYLDRNKSGIGCVKQALAWDESKYKDLSESFQGSQDLNDWLIQKRSSIVEKLITKTITTKQGRGKSI